MTIHRIKVGLAILSRRTPTKEPSMIPTSEGTTIMGITQPLFMYIHAAEVSVMERRNLLVATLIFSGAPMSRLSTGTLAHPAPRPNMPAMTPIKTNRPSPKGVLCTFQSIISPVLASW